MDFFNKVSHSKGVEQIHAREQHSEWWHVYQTPPAIGFLLARKHFYLQNHHFFIQKCSSQSNKAISANKKVMAILS